MCKSLFFLLTNNQCKRKESLLKAKTMNYELLLPLIRNTRILTYLLYSYLNTTTIINRHKSMKNAFDANFILRVIIEW